MAAPESPVRNLYVHVPFCRRRCAYCALHSHAGATERARADYVRALNASLASELADHTGKRALATIYFGGGSPALCDLAPVFKTLAPYRAPDAEVTVELHPLDTSLDTLKRLRDFGVNRISMGVQSLDDAILADMGRGYTALEARAAFDRVKSVFDNAGIDLIVGYPGACAREVTRTTGKGTFSGANGFDLKDWPLVHCSVYSLILEEKSILAHRKPTLPTDDAVMDALARVADALEAQGLRRYEISNYALPGRECRHNRAVWRGEDYLGVGEGAYGRVGLSRTVGLAPDPTCRSPFTGCETTTVTPAEDLKERTIFRLRTREGLDTSRFAAWRERLDRFTHEGLLTREGVVYRLTRRGAEVCDAILAEIV